MMDTQRSIDPLFLLCGAFCIDSRPLEYTVGLDLLCLCGGLVLLICCENGTGG